MMFREKEVTKKNPKRKSDLFNKTIKRCGKFCAVCFRVTNLELHYIVPLIEGGEEIKKNLVIVCKECKRKLKEHNVKDPITFWRIVFRNTVEYKNVSDSTRKPSRKMGKTDKKSGK